ncbi:MAG: ferredoxin [Acidimicrobiales bacterium]
MRVEVDEIVCQGTGYCQRIAPEVFEVVDGIAKVLVSDPGEELHDKVDEAERICPSRAITV